MTVRKPLSPSSPAFGQRQPEEMGYLPREVFEVDIEAEVKKAKNKEPLSLVMLTIESTGQSSQGNKPINSDLILEGLARIVKRHLRTRDRIYRYDRECLAIILLYSSNQEAKIVIDRLLRLLQKNLNKDAATQPGLSFDISIGLASKSTTIGCAAELVRATEINKTYRLPDYSLLINNQ